MLMSIDALMSLFDVIEWTIFLFVFRMFILYACVCNRVGKPKGIRHDRRTPAAFGSKQATSVCPKSSRSSLYDLQDTLSTAQPFDFVDRVVPSLWIGEVLTFEVSETKRARSARHARDRLTTYVYYLRHLPCHDTDHSPVPFKTYSSCAEVWISIIHTLPS